MKKIFAFAIAAVTMTVGCQKIQELVNPDRNQTQIENDDPVEIKFTTNVATVDTKAGTGALDALSANQTLYIYGLNRSNPTKRPIVNAPAQAIVNEGDDGVNVSWLDENLTVDDDIAYFYNGTNDMYDFYGYYVGDAAGANPEPSDTDYKLSVTIDGQHDILLAKAEGDDDAKTYSAMTARQGTTPNLEFKHQLSQFIFKVRNHGNSDIVLTDVDVNTLTKGTLTVAETARGGSAQGLVPAASTEDDLALPMTTNKDLQAKSSDTESSWVDLDGSVMVFPAQETYNIKLTLTQTGVDGERVVTVPFKYSEGIVAGSAYTLSITVYSLTEAGVTASLAEWNPVQVDEIDTEKYDGVDDSEGDSTTPTPTTPVFAVTPETLEIEATETSFTVSVTLDGEAPTTEEDITVDAGELADPTYNAGVYTFTVDANQTQENITYTVKFTYGTQEKTVTVTHKAAVTQETPEDNQGA